MNAALNSQEGNLTPGCESFFILRTRQEEVSEVSGEDVNNAL